MPLNIDADVLKAAQAKAVDEDISIGKALSEMARQGAKPAPTVSRRKNRLPQFTLPGNVIITPASVHEAQEEDDACMIVLARRHKLKLATLERTTDNLDDSSNPVLLKIA